MPDDFRKILEDYQNRVYNQAYRMLGNAEDAEETTQDIFLKIYKKLEDFRGESALSTWIYRITSNECISRLRKKQLDTTSLDETNEPDGYSLADVIPDNAPDAGALLESNEAAEMIRDEVRRLPSTWAMAISLYHFDDLSYDEIAEAMDTPRATVATYISRGRKQLTKQMVKFVSE